MSRLAGIAEGLVAGLIQKGVERIATRKKLTPQELTVLLLHEQSRSFARLENTIGRLENGMESIANELKELRKEIVPLLLQERDISEIKAEIRALRTKSG